MENWKAIPEWEGYYEVSDQGQVRSVERTLTFSDGRVRRYKSETLKLKLNVNGYPLAALNRGCKKQSVDSGSCSRYDFLCRTTP